MDRCDSRPARVGALIFGVVFLASLQTVCHAATIVVDDPTFASGGPGCTLADAVRSANANLAYGGCAAGERLPVVDVIEIAVEGIIVAGEEMRLREDVQIRGPGPDVLILRGDFAVRPFYLEAHVRVWMSGFAVYDGFSQGDRAR